MFFNVVMGRVATAAKACCSWKVVALSTAVGVGLTVGYLGLGPTRRYLGTRALTKLMSCSAAISSSEEVRDRFRALSIPELPARSEAHSHPISSQLRTRADIALDRFITACGYKIYSVSMSKRDVANGNDGHRLFFTAKDVALTPRVDSITRKHMLKFMDTDYYCDIRDYASDMNTMVMYTFAPKKVAGPTADACFHTDADGYLHLTSDGGARYVHRMWDYDTDHLVFDYWWGSAFYLVESQQVDDDRRIVGLFPVRRVYGPMGWWLPGKRLEHRKINHGAINITRYQDKCVTYISLARPRQTFCVTTSEECLTAIMIRLASKKCNDADIADIERFLMTDGFATPGKKAALLFDNLKDICDYLGLPVMTNTGRALPEDVTYQGLGPLITEDAKPKARVIMQSLVTNGNVAPGASYNNDTLCVQKRILDTRNHVTHWPPIIHRWKEEFVRFLIPDELMHVGVPDSIETVMEKQSRPTQRAGALAALPFAFCYRVIVKSFQKGESYPKIAAPRNISTLDADHRTRYGGYLYALTKTVLKPQHWYAFSKTPLEIATEVQRVANGARFIVPTDYSAWDGTHSKPLCDFENLVLRRFFAPEYHEEVSKLQMSQYKAPGVTRHGVRYTTEWSRLSGSSDTSSFNTIDNALVMFCALRDSGRSPDEAWNGLGLFGGDDGIQANLDVAWINRIVKRMGHVLKAKVIEPNHPVDFLGRYYLDPWTSPASVIDVQRQLRKLHITHSAHDVPWHVALYCKAHGLMTTDAKTPVIAQWATKVMRELEHVYGRGVLASKLDKHSTALKEDKKWFSSYEFQEQFPQLELDHPLANDFVANQLGVTTVDLANIIDRLNAAVGPEILTIGPLFILPEREVAVGAVIGGEVFLPPAPTQISSANLPIHDDVSNGKDSSAVECTTNQYTTAQTPKSAGSKQSDNRPSDPPVLRETPRYQSRQGSPKTTISDGRSRSRRSSISSVRAVDNTSRTALADTPQPSRHAQLRQSPIPGISEVSPVQRDQHRVDAPRTRPRTDRPRGDRRKPNTGSGRTFYPRPSMNGSRT